MATKKSSEIKCRVRNLQAKCVSKMSIGKFEMSKSLIRHLLFNTYLRMRIIFSLDSVRHFLAYIFLIDFRELILLLLNISLKAPKSMKTVTIAAWYLSVAMGNFLVIVITQARLFRSQVSN